MFGRGSQNIRTYLWTLVLALLLAYVAMRWGPAPVRGA